MKQEWLVPVERLRAGPGEVDQDGEPIPGSGTATVEALPDGLFNPGGSTIEMSPGVAAVQSTPSVYWPGLTAVDVTTSDKLRIRGTIWLPAGKPAVWPKGVVIMLKATEAK